MRRAPVGTPEQLVYLDGGAAVVAIGLAFSIAGAVFLYLGLTEPITLGRVESAGLMGTIGCTALSLLFVLLGMAIMVSRSGTTLDRQARTVHRWWGVWRPWGGPSTGDGVPGNVRALSRSRPRRLTDHAEVAIGRTLQKVGNQNREQITYPVRLGCDPSLVLTTYADELAARQLATEVAAFFGLAIVDGSSGTEVRREADTLDQPLVERANHLGLPAALPPAPDDMGLTYTVEEDRLTFIAPREPFDPFLLVHLVGPVLFSLGVYFVLYRGQAIADLPAAQQAPAVRAMVLVLGLPLVLGWLAFTSAIYWGGRLTVTTDGVRVNWRFWPWSMRIFKLNELEEVRVAKAKVQQWRVSWAGFNIQSDPDAEILELQLLGKRQIVGFGRGRPRAELEWVREVILKAIVA
jgi:hypothetical protein